MCYIWRCIGWVLDFIQSCLTFVLACLLMCVICIGLSTAIIAGVAYGYHYSLAEFLTFTRHDVAVYVRRGGQFADKPDLKLRRSGDEEDSFPSNRVEYPDVPVNDPKPLSDTWSKIQDSRSYVEKLNKYSELTRQKLEPLSRIEEPSAKTESPQTSKSIYVGRVSIVPVSIVTSSIPHGPIRTIVMRNFKPVHDKILLTTPPVINRDDDFYNEEPMYRSKKKKTDKRKKTPAKTFNSINFIPMRHWSVTTSRTKDELTDDIDEDHIVYKYKPV